MADDSYGSDLSGVYDLDPSGAVVTGNRLLAEAIVRRLITPRGRLIDDPDYGTEIAAYLKSEMTQRDLAAMKAAIRAECKKDERVADARVVITVIATVGPTGIKNVKSGRYSILITLVTATGPFDMTVAADDLNLELLTVEP